MFCYKCGQQLEDNAPFCGACGARQADAEQPKQQAQQQQQEQPAQQQQQQFANQPNYQQQFDQGNVYAVPNKPKKSLGWAWIVIIAEGVVALILLIAFFAVNSSKSSPEAVAEDYVNAILTGDIDSAYDNLYLEDNKLLTKESFVRTFNEDFSMIKGYVGGSKDVLGGAVDYNSISAGDGRELVTVSYNGIPFTSFTIIKEDKNRFLFFPSWKVGTDEFVAKNVKLKVPTDAKIYIDGVEVDKDYLSDDKTEYHLPALFKGSHTLAMEFDDYKTLPSSFSTGGYDSYVSVNSVSFSEEDQKKIIEEAYSCLTNVVNAHLAGQSFDSISGLYSKDSLSNERQSYEYASRYGYAKTNQYGTGITDVSINNARGAFSSAGIKDGKITATLNLKYRNTNNGLMSYYTYIGFRGIQETRPGVDRDNDENDSITLKYENGKWVISSMGQTGVDGNCQFASV